MRSPAAGTPPHTLSLVQLLRQLTTVVGSLTREQYAQSPPAFAPSCIGAHVRHCLAHVASLLEAADSGVLDYDRRERGTTLEREPEEALVVIDDMVRRLGAIPADLMKRPVLVRTLLSAERPPVDLASSLERELAYVVSHTTHHNAIIGLLVKAAGGRVPERFGYAASTIAWLAEMEEASCAR